MLIALLLATSGCQVADPTTRAATDYLVMLQPLLQENSLIAERVLFQAAALYNDATVADEVAAAWTSDIVPLAEHLHHQASFVSAPAEWTSSHSALVTIWGERATAYRNISEGLRMADTAKWDQGRNMAATVKIQEEEWFDTVNTTIAPMGFVIDAYP